MKGIRLVLWWCVLVCVGLPVVAAAQSTSRIEVAGHAAVLRFDDMGMSAGIGGRVTFDVSRFFAIEAELNVFPSDNLKLASGTALPRIAHLTYHRRRTDALFGGKLGYRGSRLGVFGRLRPGVAWLDSTGIGCDGDVCALILIAQPEYKRELVLDAGGTFEFYPSSRSVARFDVGNMMIRHRSLAPPCSRCTTNNFTSRIGGGFRF